MEAYNHVFTVCRLFLGRLDFNCWLEKAIMHRAACMALEFLSPLLTSAGQKGSHHLVSVPPSLGVRHTWLRLEGWKCH
jgi:hypothetical protein